MGPRITQVRLERVHMSRARRRALVLGILLGLWFAGLIARLYSLQIIDYGDLCERARRQQQHTIRVSPQRGEIFDRQRNPLAISVAVDSVFALPHEIPDRSMVVDLLAPALGLDGNELLGRLTKNHTFCWVKRDVSAEEARRVGDLSLRGVYCQRDSKRFYTQENLAAQVLGYVGTDGTGLAGLEYGQDAVMRGVPGSVVVQADARRKPFQSSEWPGKPSKPGKNLVLTLDERIQYAAEKALAEAVQKWQAVGGVVVVQNPNTGEILAMASQPTYDPNYFARSRPEALQNRAVSWVYEPGSTFKLVTVAAALEEKLTTPEEAIDCQQGMITLAGHVIHDHKSFAVLTVRNVVAQSSDVGAIKLGLRLGPERIYKYIGSFGFGEKTRIELPGEERGMLNSPSRWSGISIGEISIGQEVGVTPIQLVTAYSAVANGGVLFEPRLIHDIYLGTVHDAIPPVPGHRVISERTANLMKQILAAVVETGTGQPARLSGYSVAGKTGTAQKIDASGRYSKRNYVASFVGFAPVPRPAVTILVAIDSPVGEIYGAEVAAPVFKQIAEQTLGYLDVPTDAPARPAPPASPGPTDESSKGEAGSAGQKGREPRGAGAPSLQVASLEQTVRADAAAASATPPSVYLDGAPQTTVPDFSGMGARRIAQECQKRGLVLRLEGSGLAVAQDPPAHTPAPLGSNVVVRLARFAQ